ncbi:Uncharacterised protein [Halioglobus japonicus]|nr:Uncharacterised protein [Halioglobus japonicus]
MGEQEQVLSKVDSTMPTRVLAILGMHRSGTSCLTGSLQAAGLFLGDCHTWNKHNEKGNRENQKFVDLHDAILAANGGAWDSPPATAVWQDEHVAWATDLLQAHAGESTFGFKDPRALLVIDGWKALYPKMEFIGIYRHPNAVAKSLEKRNYRHRDEWLELWYAYNTILYQQYLSNPFPILCFDDDEALLDDKIIRAAGQLGLVRKSDDHKFYTSELRHNDSSGDQALPEHISQLYQKLKNAEF